METASRPRRHSLGETERRPVFVTGLSTVDIDSKGGRAASTSKLKEAGRRKDDSKVSFQLATLTVQLVTHSEARLGSSASSIESSMALPLSCVFKKYGLYEKPLRGNERGRTAFSTTDE